jgi:hypothetical protein
MNRPLEVTAYHATAEKIEGDFWPGTCFADSRAAACGYLDGPGWLYTVEIVGLAGPAGAGEPDAELVAPEDLFNLTDWHDVRHHAEAWGYDLLCYQDNTEGGIRHETYRLLDGAVVAVLNVRQLRP